MYTNYCYDESMTNESFLFPGKSSAYVADLKREYLKIYLETSEAKLKSKKINYEKLRQLGSISHSQ